MITIENIGNRDTQAGVFIRAYLEAALWSSVDDDGEPLDDGRDYSDYSTETIDATIKECGRFIELYKGMFNDNYCQAGHDFWLTRNGHGAGFWDHPEVYGAANAEKLTEVCGFRTEFDSIDLFIGNDGKVYHD